MLKLITFIFFPVVMMVGMSLCLRQSFRGIIYNTGVLRNYRYSFKAYKIRVFECVLMLLVNMFFMVISLSSIILTFRLTLEIIKIYG